MAGFFACSPSRAKPNDVLYVVDGTRIATVVRDIATMDVSTDHYFRVGPYSRPRVNAGGPRILHPETVARVGIEAP